MKFVFGGTRSGKSEYAESLCRAYSENILYLATAIPLDDGMKSRIKKHQMQRPSHWTTIERYKHFESLLSEPAYRAADMVLLDCITVMVTNLMFEDNRDIDQMTQVEIDAMEVDILNEIRALTRFIKSQDKPFVLVSSEVGLGLVAPYKSGNVFRDLVGKANQIIAAAASEVYFVLAGIPMKIK